MKKAKASKNSTRPNARQRIKQKFSPGWNEQKVRAIIEHYDNLTEEEWAHEIETAPEVTDETLISVPTKLLPAIRKLIIGCRKSV